MEFYPDDMDPISRGTELGSEVIQFECDSEKVPQMLKAHPELKAVFFAEHFETGEVYLAYSESGYPTVTDIRLVGYCDQNVKDKWMRHLDPTQDFYNRLDARYLFLERARWESLDYALRYGKSRLAGGKVIPSRPYKREPFYISPQRLINGLVKKFGTEPFTEPPVNAEAEEIYNLAEYFASAVFRGYEFEVDKALSEIYQVNEDWLPQKIKLGDGIAQFACPSELVPKFVKKYPCMKAIFFAEDWRAEEMYLAYSESGCPTVSDIRHVGIFIADRECRFGLMHDPTEEAFDEPECEYVFIEKPRWEKYDYALPNRRRKLTGGKVIPSMPYKKDPFSTQCEIIEIRYPENEIFYEGYKESGCD